MKFSVGAVLAFAAAALALPKFTNSDFTITEGEPFTLKWTDAEGPVTITLKTGPEENLQTVTVLTSGETGNEFTWTPSDLPSGTYAFEITDSTEEPNYSVRFPYTGTASSSTSLSSTITSTETSSETSSTSASSTSTETETETSTTTSSSESSTSTTSSTSTSTEGPTSTRGSEPTNDPENLNSGQRFASPLGFVLVTVAALIFFN
ncbi:Ser-Thr-rich glycosyl-phosphatidyl-inositol-anchored membrane family-domain-containing protein [Corynascus similis CBS 632.67]